MLGTKDVVILKVVVAQINKKFQLHQSDHNQIWCTGSSHDAIKSSKFQLDRDAALGAGHFKKSNCTFHHSIFNSK
jgi:hypothetical protein